MNDLQLHNLAETVKEELINLAINNRFPDDLNNLELDLHCKQYFGRKPIDFVSIN